MPPNWQNRTMWTGDNLDIMRSMNSESVDLIYLDPPFNSNRTYSAPIGSEAAGAAFKDTWILDDVDLAWHGEIAEREPALYAVIDAAGQAHSKGMMAYVIMMAVRLLEMQRLLKPTGSIYLHCDPTASHYLKLVMDAVFGPTRFRADITWRRAIAHSDTKQGRRQHGRVLSRLKSAIDSRGVLHLTCQASRSQSCNRAEVIERFQRLLRQALHVPKPRRPTRPGRAAVERRLQEKRRAGLLKQERRRQQPANE